MRSGILMLLVAGCGFGSGTQLAADASKRDASLTMLDGPMTGTDAPTTTAKCYAQGTPFEVCLGAVPTNNVTLTVTIDTRPGAPGSPCLAAQPIGWTTKQPPACFVVAANVTVETTRVTGSRPLVLLADVKLTVNTLLDVASHVDGAIGPGVDGMGCLELTSNPANGTDGAGGGAGGSFTTRGGNGGVGDNNKKAGGSAVASVSGPFHRLRAGCYGQEGGSSTGLAGLPGPGGGVVYLVAGSEIENSGTINASGAGGAGGGVRSGGSGGGSGGMIVLYAPSLDNRMGSLMANGGGGAGGGTGGSGSDGQDPNDALVRAQGGTTGGDGGWGYAAGMGATSGSDGASHDGGGGGGGGAGYIRVSEAVMGEKSPTPDILP